MHRMQRTGVAMELLAGTLRESQGVTGIHVGLIMEKLALYADNLVLFLHDPGPSLSEALWILAHFSGFLRLKTNWEKLLILPAIIGVKELADDNLPQQWVTSIRYLGITITSNVKDFSKLNLLPAQQWSKPRLKAWSH